MLLLLPLPGRKLLGLLTVALPLAFAGHAAAQKADPTPGVAEASLPKTPAPAPDPPPTDVYKRQVPIRW